MTKLVNQYQLISHEVTVSFETKPTAPSQTSTLFSRKARVPDQKWWCCVLQGPFQWIDAEVPEPSRTCGYKARLILKRIIIYLHTSTRLTTTTVWPPSRTVA